MVRLAALRADAACPEMRALLGDARCVGHTRLRINESHVVPRHGAACSVQDMGVRNGVGAEYALEDGS